MYHFVFVVTPQPGTDLFEETSGAYANCWINSNNKREAQKYAEGVIGHHGYVVENLETGERVSRDTYKDDPEALEHFEEASTEGSCFVYYEWPLDDAE